ncbi:hypothetical protein ACJX0J_032261, partial [Zea mays]
EKNNIKGKSFVGIINNIFISVSEMYIITIAEIRVVSTYEHNMFSNYVFQLDAAFKTSTFILTLQGLSKTKPLTLHCHLLQNSGVNMNKDIIIKKARDGAIILEAHKENNKK